MLVVLAGSEHIANRDGIPDRIVRHLKQDFGREMTFNNGRPFTIVPRGVRWQSAGRPDIEGPLPGKAFSDWVWYTQQEVPEGGFRAQLATERIVFGNTGGGSAGSTGVAGAGAGAGQEVADTPSGIPGALSSPLLSSRMVCATNVGSTVPCSLAPKLVLRMCAVCPCVRSIFPAPMSNPCC